MLTPSEKTTTRRHEAERNETMRTQTRPAAAEDHESDYADPFVAVPILRQRNGAASSERTSAPLPKQEAILPKQEAILKNDVMQESLLSAASPVPELDGQEELGPQLAWVSLDAPRGLLVCKNLDLEVAEFVGTIIESRVVRVMKDKDGGVYCASSNRIAADLGRPGKECAFCEDRAGACFPRWWIAWQEETSGQVFAHTLSQTGTLNFTRYAAKLKREGLTPSQTVTRLFVEEARRQKIGTTYRRIQFEREDPFRDE